jgi:hypothetical protein
MKRIIALLAGVALMALTTSAMAIPITGSIVFVGGLKLTGSAVPLNTQDATGLEFDYKGLVLDGGTGTYLPIKGYPSVITQVTFQDFIFAPVLSSGPIKPLWTVTYGVDTFGFDLYSVTATRIAPNGLLLNGTGILHATNYDDTVGSWSLTTQDGSGTLSFSAVSADPPVPEPSTLLFLGAGLLALTIVGKRMQEA